MGSNQRWFNYSPLRGSAQRLRWSILCLYCASSRLIFKKLTIFCMHCSLKLFFSRTTGIVEAISCKIHSINYKQSRGSAELLGWAFFNIEVENINSSWKKERFLFALFVKKFLFWLIVTSVPSEPDSTAQFRKFLHNWYDSLFYYFVAKNPDSCLKSRRYSCVKTVFLSYNWSYWVHLVLTQLNNW